MVADALQGDQKSLLTLVEILRRTGSLETKDVDSLLPDNYESILNTYVDTRLKAGARNPVPSPRKGTES